VKAIAHTWFMVGRQARNLMREPIWIVLLLLQPMIWLLLYGQLFKRVTHLPGGGFGTTSYITFLTPAIVIMNAFFGATWSGMAMVADLDRDVIPRFLATPVSRVSLVVSQIVRSALTAVIQGIVILAVSLALGVRVHYAVIGWVVVLVAAAGILQGLALLTRKEATMIAIANFIGLPLFFLSSTLISLKQMPHWMQTTARFNPVNWGGVSAREITLPGTNWGSVGLHLALLAALTVVTAGFATWTFRVYQRQL
jgi:ABC-2 type transport system permease protein